MLDTVLPTFRQAGDFRCTARALCDLAEFCVADDPGAARDLLLQGCQAAAITRDPILHVHILAKLMAAATAGDDPVLAARCLGALSALGQSARADPVVQGPAYTTFINQGRSGGIDLITMLYPPQ